MWYVKSQMPGEISLQSGSSPKCKSLTINPLNLSWCRVKISERHTFYMMVSRLTEQHAMSRIGLDKGVLLSTNPCI